MLTSPDDPHQSLPSLRHRTSKNPYVMKGHYNFSGSIITAVLKRDSKESQSHRKYKKYKHEFTPASHSFHLKLELKSLKGKRNGRLSWIEYSINLHGQEIGSKFDINQSAFPPFSFSRVKSFAQDFESLLC